MKAIWSILFVLGSTFSLLAQNSIDLATVSFRHGFSQPAEQLNANASENVALVNLKIPIVFSESNIWYSELTYQSSLVNYSKDLPGTVNPTQVHGFILQSGLVRKLDDSRAIQLLLVPRLMSDFNNVGLSHFQIGGIGLFEKRYSDHLTMRYGMMYNRELFSNMFVPLIYVDWKLGSKWRINGLIPVFAKISYQATERLSLGLSQFGLITSYQLGDPAYHQDYIERKSIDVTLFLRYQLAGNLHFEARGGYALGRSYHQYAKGDEMDFRIAIFSFGDNRVQKNVGFNPGPIIDFRLVYNLPIE